MVKIRYEALFWIERGLGNLMDVHNPCRAGVEKSKLNIGAGSRNFTPKGWLSVDLCDGSDLLCDVRQGVPLGDGACEALFASHFLEYLTLEEAQAFFRECYRLLDDGGVIRLSVPDLRFFAHKYVNEDREFFDRKTVEGEACFQGQRSCDKLMHIACGYGHKHMYDADSLGYYLQQAGFNSVRRSMLNSSYLADVELLDNRSELSLFVEGVKGEPPVEGRVEPAEYVPFMNQPEIDAISAGLRLFEGPIAVLEWGSGHSTVYFSSILHEGSRWNSVEHSLLWATTVDKALRSAGNDRAVVQHVATDKPFIQGGTDGDYSTFASYVLHPTTLGKRFDFILVDGRARAECLQIGWMILADEGLMVLHDAERRGFDRGIPGDGYCFRMTNPRVEEEKSVLFMAKSILTIKRLRAKLVGVLPDYIAVETNFDVE